MKIYKAVYHPELEQHTREGWALEQILTQDQAINVPHNAPTAVVAPPQSGYTTYHSPTVMVDTPMICRQPMFLLSKDSGMENREKDLKTQLTCAADKAKEVRAQMDALQRSHDQYKNEADRRTKELGESVNVQRQLMTAKEKIEGDMSKVRKAIGDLKYFEIVGGHLPA